MGDTPVVIHQVGQSGVGQMARFKTKGVVGRKTEGRFLRPTARQVAGAAEALC